MEVTHQEKAKKKEEICVEIEKFGGLWSSPKQMCDNLEKLNNKEKLLALKSQINFRKVVVEQVIPDKKLLQLRSTVDKKRKEFTVTELMDNSEKVIEFSIKTAEERAAEVHWEVSIRPAEERQKQLIDATNAIRDKAEAARQSQQKAAEKPEKPKKKQTLYGKRIKHKWEVEVDGEVKDVWYDGTVFQVIEGEEDNVNCQFGVKYDNVPGIFEVELLEDFKSHWVVIVRNATDEEIKACLKECNQDIEDSTVAEEEEVKDQEGTVSKQRKDSFKNTKKGAKHRKTRK